MFGRPPDRDARQILEDSLRVAGENMRTVFVNQYAGSIGAVVGVAPNVFPPVAEQYGFSHIACEAFCEDASRKSGADYQVIVGGPLVTDRARPEERLFF